MTDEFLDDEEVTLAALTAKGRRYAESRQKQEELEAALKRAKDERTEVEREFWAMIDESPLEGAIKLDLGPPFGVVVFQAKETYYGRILNQEKALEYFESRAMTDEVTEPKPVMARVHEFVRDVLDSAGDLPEGIDFYAKRYVSYTKKRS